MEVRCSSQPCWASEGPGFCLWPSFHNPEPPEDLTDSLESQEPPFFPIQTEEKCVICSSTLLPAIVEDQCPYLPFGHTPVILCLLLQQLSADRLLLFFNAALSLQLAELQILKALSGRLQRLCLLQTHAHRWTERRRGRGKDRGRRTDGEKQTRRQTNVPQWQAAQDHSICQTMFSLRNTVFSQQIPRKSIS